MPKIDFNNKLFSLVRNSEEGKASSDTIFRYKQEGDLVTADYSGGDIRYGKVVALLIREELHMLYQCLTYENELKAGKAIAKISFGSDDKMRLKLSWEWLGDISKKGSSEYLEN